MENRPNPDPLLGAPPWASELADRMRSYEQGLARLTCTVNEVNNKLDMLIAQFGASHAPVPESALTPGPWWLSYSTAPQLLQRDVASGWGFDAGNTSDLVDPSSSMPGADGGDAFRYRDPSNFGGSSSFVSPTMFNNFDPHQAVFDFAASRPASDLLCSPLPGTIPPTMVNPNDAWAVPASPPPIFQPVPLPPVAPSYEPGGQEDRIERDEGHEDFAGSVRDLTQEAESSTNLANATQPSSEENGAQSEQSNTPGASSSGGGYDRQRNAEEKRHHFFLIFEALGASWDGNELSGLPIIIGRLGGVVPQVAADSTGLNPGSKNRRKRRKKNQSKRQIYFEALKTQVGPWNTSRVRELKVLKRVLDRAVALKNEEAQVYQPYGAFHQ